jgi:alpha/beta superfamily hydrolase
MREEKSRKIRFRGGSAVELTGVLHEPLQDERPETVLLTHCFTCSKDYKVIVEVARQVAQNGFRVLRFDFTGLGDSQGEFSRTTLATNVDDLVAAAEWVAAQRWTVRALVGHSLGGTAALLAARLIAETTAVCSISSSSRSTHLLQLLPQLKSTEFSEQGSARVSIGGRVLTIRREFVDDLKRHSLEQTVAGLGKSFLAVHGTEDRTVPITEGEKLFGFARQPKAFWAVPGADHLFSESQHARQAALAIAMWLKTVVG